MNFLDRIEPYITTDDLLIHETIVYAINEYPYIPEDWSVRIIKKAFQQQEPNLTVLMNITNFPINEEALRVLLEYIPKMHDNDRHIATALLDNLKPEIALDYKDVLLPYVDHEMFDLYALLLNGEKEDVYLEYLKTLAELDQGISGKRNLLLRGKLLAKCIVENKWISESEIKSTFQELLEEDVASSIGIFTIYMIGLLELEEYIPHLASLLSREDDLLLEEVTNALIIFQSDDAVNAVIPYLTNEDSLIYAVSVPANIKTRFAVKTLQEAYKKTKGLAELDLLFEALCYHFSTDAISTIESHMAKHTTLVEVEQLAYSYYTIIGKKHPDLKMWQHYALENAMEFQDVIQEPIRNETKVGRNDPCPCGSGMKYKKCCG